MAAPVRVTAVRPRDGETFDPTNLAQVSGGLVIPAAPFVADLTCSEWPFHLSVTVAVEDGAAVCEAMVVARKPGKAIVTADLRFPLAACIRLALAAHPYSFTRTDSPAGVLVGGRLSNQTEKLAAQPEQKRRDTAASRSDVVKAYRTALANPATSRRAVAEVVERTNLSRGYVTRLLAAARDRGELPPDAIGRGGQPKQRPIKRGKKL